MEARGLTVEPLRAHTIITVAAPDPDQSEKSDPDPHQREKEESNPHQTGKPDANPQSTRALNKVGFSAGHWF